MVCFRHLITNTQCKVVNNNHRNIAVTFSVLCSLFFFNYITIFVSFPPDNHVAICLWFSLRHFIRVILMILLLIYLLTAIVLTPGGSSTVHIYAQKIPRTTD